MIRVSIPVLALNLALGLAACTKDAPVPADLIGPDYRYRTPLPDLMLIPKGIETNAVGTRYLAASRNQCGEFRQTAAAWQTWGARVLKTN